MEERKRCGRKNGGDKREEEGIERVRDRKRERERGGGKQMTKEKSEVKLVHQHTHTPCAKCSGTIGVSIIFEQHPSLSPPKAKALYRDTYVPVCIQC